MVAIRFLVSTAKYLCVLVAVLCAVIIATVLGGDSS